MPMPLVDRSDLGGMLLATVRYAIGRNSYFPIYAMGCVRKYFHKLIPNDQASLLRDLREHIEERGSSDVFAREWTVLLEELTLGSSVEGACVLERLKKL